MSLSEASLRKRDELLKLNKTRMEQQKAIEAKCTELANRHEKYLMDLPRIISDQIQVNVDKCVREAMKNVGKVVARKQRDEELKRLDEELKELEEEELRAQERLQAILEKRAKQVQLKEALNTKINEYKELLEKDRELVQQQIRLQEALKNLGQTAAV